MKYVDWAEFHIPNCRNSNCRNCGAPITKDKCEYCGTIYDGETIITNEFDKPLVCPRCGGSPTIWCDADIFRLGSYNVYVSCSKCNSITPTYVITAEGFIDLCTSNAAELLVMKKVMNDFKNGNFVK